MQDIDMRGRGAITFCFPPVTSRAGKHRVVRLGVRKSRAISEGGVGHFHFRAFSMAWRCVVIGRLGVCMWLLRFSSCVFEAVQWDGGDICAVHRSIAESGESIRDVWRGRWDAGIDNCKSSNVTVSSSDCRM